MLSDIDTKRTMSKPAKKARRFIQIKPDRLRGKYGEGRVALKISLPPARFNAMNELGVMIQEEGKDGRKVARRGGQGSPFIDLALEMLEYAFTEYPDAIEQRRDAANLLRRLDDATFFAEDVAIIKNNLVTFYELITGKNT